MVTAGDTTYINWALTSAPTVTVTLQPDPALGKDTLVYHGQPTANYGSYNYVSAGGYDVDSMARAYLQFDLSPIPSTAVVTDADLYLWYYRFYAGSTAMTVDAYQVTASWDENTMTWDTKAPYNGAIVQGSAWVPANPTDNFIDWDLRNELVQGWIDGSITNYGIMLMDSEESTPNWPKGFYSSVWGTAAQRPKLVISYYDPADP